MLEQRLYYEAQHVWLIKLLNYDCEVEYWRGKDNISADSLSRQSPAATSSLLSISLVQDAWVEELKAELATDPFLKQLGVQWNNGLLDATRYIPKEETSTTKARSF